MEHLQSEEPFSSYPYFSTYCQLGFSLKIEMPRLGSDPSQLGSAQAGKFQLVLNTST